jgi:hypothetical protein
MKINLYGYASDWFYKGKCFDSPAKAEEIKALLGREDLKIEAFDQSRLELKQAAPHIYGSPDGVDLNPCPEYNWTFDQAKAEGNSKHQIFPANFPVLTFEVDLIGRLNDRILIKGELPLNRFANPYKIILLSGNENIPANCPNFSVGAINLIEDFRNGDGGIMNGVSYENLLEIEGVINKRSKLRNPVDRRPYAPDEITAIDYREKSGSLKTIFTYSVGYFEGYSFSIFKDFQSAEKYYNEEIEDRLSRV